MKFSSLLSFPKSPINIRLNAFWFPLPWTSPWLCWPALHDLQDNQSKNGRETVWNARMRPERLFFYQHGIASNSRWSIVWMDNWFLSRWAWAHIVMYKDSITVDFAMLLNLYVKQVTKTMLKHRVSKTTLGALSKKTMLEYRHASTQSTSNMKSFIHNRFEKQFGSNPKVFLCINWAMINDISGRRKGRGTPYGTKAGFATISRIIPITNMNHEISINYK